MSCSAEANHVSETAARGLDKEMAELYPASPTIEAAAKSRLGPAGNVEERKQPSCPHDRNKRKRISILALFQAAAKR